ncbi:ABC transporter permease [Jiangella sp. DSM 45060]|uniref:ABC transporter permease n=1 Tax=Jiangella sp. DSM 45060 TaxID=1798224 RepID=UPI00087954B4|nr:ABC transporter permease [Jiangella sp. DSM 45060]SDT11344.1 peptide/nickel transport system permease protein [Jiangella sp. DSM 45060]
MAAPDTVAPPAAEAVAAPRPSFLRRLLSSTGQRIAWAIVALLVLAAVAAPLLAPYEPNAQDLRNTLQPPGGGHLLGTDDFGRDQLSRLFYALRSSLFIGLATTAGVALIGLPVGLLAGYARGALDVVVARVIDVGLALPSLVLALGLIAAMGAGMQSTIIALVAGYAAYLARVVRSVVLQVRQEEYVESARVTGVRPWRIVLRHVLPNVLGATTVQLTLIFAFAIVGEAGLSFVGLGVQPPSASLGNMLAEGANYTLEAPALAVAPGVVIAVLLMALLFAGDGLRDAADPRRSR